MTSIWDFSATATSNTAAVPAGFATGNAPSNVRVMFQNFMAFLTESTHALTTTGSANAYVGTLTNVPASLTTGMVISVNPNFTNTGAATFNLNSLGAKNIKLTTLVALTGSEMQSGGEYFLVYDGTQWQLLNPSTFTAGPSSSTDGDVALFSGTTGALLKDSGFPFGQASAHGQCRLVFTDATHVTLQPYAGNLIRIAGTLFAIPSAGVAALSTSTFINGAGAQALAASTTYFVYLFNNGGTLALDFSTTGHATDTAAGNVGVEIKTALNSRTLVGVVRTNGSSQFENDNTLLGVRSWFNRPGLAAVQSVSLVGQGSAAFAGVGTTIGVVVWADDMVTGAQNITWATGGTGGGNVLVAISQDGSQVTESGQVTVTSSNSFYNTISTITRTLSEGFHTLQNGIATSSLGSTAAASSQTVLDVGIR